MPQKQQVITLSEMLSKVADSRSLHGLRFPLTDFLLMCIMAIMSGYSSYRGMGRFLKNNEKDFRRAFGSCHGVPCYVTISEAQCLAATKKQKLN